MKGQVMMIRTAAMMILVAAFTCAEPAGGADATKPSAATANTHTDWPNLEQVIVVSKTHFDIGFTAMASEVVQRYRTSMIDNALNVIDQSNALPPEQRFRWTLAGWPLSRIGADWPGQIAERKARIEQALRRGRLVVHALPFTTHTEMNELETLVRGLGWSSRVCRSVDLPLARAAKMTDVPCHSWIMPTLLHHAGIEFLHLGCNPGSSSPEVPLLFWWVGADGSRLLTMYIPTGYGTGVIPPKTWPYKTWLAMLMTGDNHGPPRADEVRRLFDQARRQLPSRVKVRFGRLEDFADAIRAEKPDLPVVRGDMPDTWIHGPMANPQGIRRARHVVPRIAATEAMGTLLDAWGIKPPHADIASTQAADRKTIADAYEQSLLYGEHTWGGSIGWFGRKMEYGQAWRDAHAAGKYQRNEDSWEEHTDYIRHADALITPLMKRDLASLAASVKVTGRRIVVFNALPWARDGLVTLPRDSGDITAVKEVPSGQTAPVDPTTHQFIARNVESMGYRTYVPVATAVSASPRAPQNAADTHTIESRYFKATLDPADGTIASLIDKTTGRELVDHSAPQGMGQYLYERFSRADIDRWTAQYIKIKAHWALTGISKPDMPPAEQAPYVAASPQSFDLTVRRSPMAITATMHAQAGHGVPHPVTLRLTLYDDLPCADLSITLHDKPADAWPEGGWLCLPLKVDAPRFRLGRLGGIIDPATDIVPGANHDMLWLNSGMAVVDSTGRGVGLCPVDSPLVSLGRPGLWRHSPRRDFDTPRVYVNLFNNQWSTNFRLWNSGTWTSRIRLWSIERYEAQRDLFRPAWQVRSPMLAASFDGPAGPLSPQQAGLQLSRKGVLVTAFGANPDGPGLVLRLWEQAGQSGPCTITLPAAMKRMTVQPIDLRGRPLGQPLSPAGGTWTVTLQANAPASFRLTR